MNEAKRAHFKSVWRNNSSPVQLLGLCPLLAVSNTSINAFGLGVATTLVLVFTNTAVSALRRWIPREIRIPIYTIIIASVVISVQMFTNAYVFALYQSIGIFIPLITTNCIVISQAETCALQRSPMLAALDGLAIGLNSMIALLMLGSMREVLGNGTLFSGADQLLGKWACALSFEVFHTDTSFLLAKLPPGAFIGLGFMLAGKYFVDQCVMMVRRYK